MARLLRAGGVIAFPTDTVYGLGADARSAAAVRSIYKLKIRDPRKPLPILVESLASARVLGRFSRGALALARAFWPGPLTLVLKPTAAGRRAAQGFPSLGLRVPGHDGLRGVLRAARVPFASTSANRSGEPECRDTAAVAAAFPEGLAAVLDGGTVRGKPSTVVDFTGEQPVLLREGRLRWSQVLRTLKRPR